MDFSSFGQRFGCDTGIGLLMDDLGKVTADWDYDAVTVGFPAPMVDGRIGNEPKNLGVGWMDFRFEEAFGRPVKLINDAAMQAVGCYEGGRMLFLSLGTGLGSAMIADYHVIGRFCRHAPIRDKSHSGV